MQQLITGLLFVVYKPLNMFRASLCPSSGAYQLLPPRSYGKPEAAAAAVDRLLIMGIRMPETCCAVSRRQTLNP
jgi:hypothetical protein